MYPSVVPYENALNIFTDGSCLPKPRRGGIGVRFVYVDSSGAEEVDDYSFLGYQQATNNQMELMACIKGLEFARKFPLPPYVQKIWIFTDSKYVVDNYENAIFNWPKNQWCNLDGKPILNIELWKQLVKWFKKTPPPVSIKWCKGHSKCEHNRAADKMAKDSANTPTNPPLTPVSVRHKKSGNLAKEGSVEMSGQRLTIHIITCEHLPAQNLWRYRYEVMSKNSPFYKCVDFIFWEDFLSSGHTYYVKVNSNQKNPRIEKKYREVESKGK